MTQKDRTFPPGDGSELLAWEAAPRTVYLLRRDLGDEIVCEVGVKHRRYWYDELTITPFEKWQDDGGYDKWGRRTGRVTPGGTPTSRSFTTTTA